MQRNLIAWLFLLACMAPGIAQEALKEKTPSFAGKWETTYGTMTLEQTGNKVTGFYIYGIDRSTISGTVKDRTMTFTYQEPGVTGEGSFELAANGKTFTGKWRPKGSAVWGEWTGRRIVGGVEKGFSGLWKTTYGSMRLVKTATGIEGIYGAGGASTIKGILKGNRLTFNYTEPEVKGQGWFEISSDGKSFRGQWKENGSSVWASWNGTRVQPVSGRTWLVVLEVNWEADLNQQEYSFGKMLSSCPEIIPFVLARAGWCN